VIGGMIFASAIGIFLIPAIFVMVEKLSGAKKPELGMLPVPSEGD